MWHQPPGFAMSSSRCWSCVLPPGAPGACFRSSHLYCRPSDSHRDPTRGSAPCLLPARGPPGVPGPQDSRNTLTVRALAPPGTSKSPSTSLVSRSWAVLSGARRCGRDVPTPQATRRVWYLVDRGPALKFSCLRQDSGVSQTSSDPAPAVWKTPFPLLPGDGKGIPSLRPVPEDGALFS